MGEPGADGRSLLWAYVDTPGSEQYISDHLFLGGVENTKRMTG